MASSSAPHSVKILNRAPSQADRRAGAPAPGKVAVDGRSLAQLLAFAARYGKLIRFYDIENRPQGDWSDFFAQDQAVANAVHACLDLPEIEHGMRRLLSEIHGAETDAERHALLTRVAEAVVRLLGLLDRAPDHGDDPWDTIARFARTGRRDGLAQPLQGLHRHLGGQDFATHPSRGAGDWVRVLTFLLEEVVVYLIDELRRGAAAAEEAVAVSLGTLGHAPQAALYNAFVQLYDEARGEINRFPQRLLDFYYLSILGQSRRAEQPDHLFLTFTLAKGAGEASIPHGTLFSAGQDAEGQPVLYAADSALEVMPASVAKLAVHRVVGGDGSGDAATARGVLTGVVKTGADGTPSAPFPLFGSDGDDASESLSMTPATIGFMVSSPILMLAGGERTVTLALTLRQADAEDGVAAPIVAHAMAGGLGADPMTQAAAAAIEQAFGLFYSTAGGWVAVQSYTCLRGQAPNQVLLSFQLPADAPPLVALGTAPSPPTPPPALPADAFPAPALPTLVAKFHVPKAHDGPLTAFDLLSQQEVAEASVTVKVRAMPLPVLSTSGGPIDPKQNFALFGLAPAAGSQLRIPVPELFVKTPASLALTIDWAGLPVSATGFQGYYKGYVLDADGGVSPQPLFDNAAFQVSLGVLSAGSWDLPAGHPLYLFQTAGPGATTPPVPAPTPAPAAPLLPSTVLTAPAVTAQATPLYYDPASSALLVTLAGPAYAFGAALYPANLTAAANANVATLQTQAKGAGATTSYTATAQIADAAAANAAADDGTHAKTVGAAIDKAVSALNAHALAALQRAPAQGASPDAAAERAQSLQQAVTAPRKTGFWAWLTGSGKADAASIAAHLGQWVSDHETELAGDAGTALREAKAALAAAGSLLSAAKATAGQSVASARATLAAALQHAQAALGQGAGPASGTSSTTPPAPLPNPPWLPMASAVTLDYSASATVLATQLSPEGEAPSPSRVPASAPDFHHLALFGEVRPAGAEAKPVTVLPEIEQNASLYIDLSDWTDRIALLFVLQAGPNGWSSDKPDIAWEQYVGSSWVSLTPVFDGTNGLTSSGIVTLQLHRQPAGIAHLRARLVSGLDMAPYVKSVTTNALIARWHGPGGAASLGNPLPAGTITQSQAPIAGLGGIVQPEESLGGSPPATGLDFDLWMAERLRHRGYAVESWDHARLTLAAVPMLWQAAVVPATDPGTGEEAPGKIWVVAVAGRDTPNVPDPTIPQVSPEVLAEIGGVLETVCSPFADIHVTNPPYQRLTVVADIIFSDGDTAEADKAALQAELVKWLSPWPDQTLGDRPPDYYSRQAIADFICSRSYVKGIARLRLKLDKDAPPGWRYLTSAHQHLIRPVSDQAPAGNR